MIKKFNLARRFDETRELYFEYMQDINDRETVNNGYYTNCVEKYLQNLSGRKHALLTNCGSNSLLLSMMVYNIGPGDEVIITNFSCPASLTFVKTVGATPVYCDVDETGVMDPANLDGLITDRTRAIVATGLYGDMHDHNAISSFAKLHGIHYINDAAQSILASKDGNTSLSCGDLVTLSFAENKIIPAIGTHGALLTDSTELYYNLMHLRKHGKPYRKAPFTARGLNGVPEEDNAAQIYCSTHFIEKWQKRRHEIAEYYDKEFTRRGVTMRPHDPEWNTHKYVIMTVDPFRMQQEILAEGDVETEVQYPDAFSDLPNSNIFASQCLTIPLNAHLTDAEVEIITDTVEKVWKKNNM